MLIFNSNTESSGGGILSTKPLRLKVFIETLYQNNANRELEFFSRQNEYQIACHFVCDLCNVFGM